MREERIFLTRRNLQTLLNKLDRRKAGGSTECAIIKRDNTHPMYPQTMEYCRITAVENEDYYTNREPGLVLPEDLPK